MAKQKEVDARHENVMTNLTGELCRAARPLLL